MEEYDFNSPPDIVIGCRKFYRSKVNPFKYRAFTENDVTRFKPYNPNKMIHNVKGKF